MHKEFCALLSAVGQDGNATWKEFVSKELKDDIDALDDGKMMVSLFSVVQAFPLACLCVCVVCVTLPPPFSRTVCLGSVRV